MKQHCLDRKATVKSLPSVIVIRKVVYYQFGFSFQISESPVEMIRTEVVGYSVQPDNITVLCDSEEVDELVITQKLLKTLLPFETDEQMNKNLLLLCDSVVKFHLKGNEILDMEIVNDE